jgi:hypothetical protein
MKRHSDASLIEYPLSARPPRLRMSGCSIAGRRQNPISDLAPTLRIRHGKNSRSTMDEQPVTIKQAATATVFFAQQKRADKQVRPYDFSFEL